MNYIQSGNAPQPMPVPTPIKPFPVACATQGGTLYSNGQVYKDNVITHVFIFIAMITIAVACLAYALIFYKRK